MGTLPSLVEEDISLFENSLKQLISKSEASSALIVDKAGFLISHLGTSDDLDCTTLGALAAASFIATQGIASLIGESNFSNVYQQGDQFSLFVANIDEHCLLIVVFKASISVGAVKYYVTLTVPALAKQLQVAKERSPDEDLDLSVLNVADTAAIFRRK